MRWIISSVLVLAVASTALAEKGLRFKLDEKRQTILPVGYSSAVILGLDRSGGMVELNPREIIEPKIIPRFKPYSHGEVRADLSREFGGSFEVTGTGNYLVVHPNGTKDLWANRFEELHRSMLHFFSQRGFRLSKPKFPLAGVVFYSRAQYNQYISREFKTNASNTAGLYMHQPNRIYLFDATRGQGTRSSAWEDNLGTIMHEAAHQTAYNCGVHKRYGRTPRWVSEGLGCLFEAPGIYDAFNHRDQKDRLNLVRLRDFKKIPTDYVESTLIDIVTSERIFTKNPSKAYAMSWAMTFYFSERYPRDYIRYLKTTSKLGPFDKYTSRQRMADFQASFGKDTEKIANRLSKFVGGLKAK